MKAKFFSMLFTIYNKFFQLKNRRKPHILVYSDSRGFNVISKWGKQPFESYVKDLVKKYHVTYFICPQKFTTLVDFLELGSVVNLSQFEVVVLHCGVVDFSPRPVSNIEEVKKSKIGNQMFNKLFELNKTHYENPSQILYSGEPTVTIYSEDYLRRFILPNLSAMSNLVWIDTNPFIVGWEGNFVKGRPANISEMVTRFEKILSPFIENQISLKSWGEDDVKRYTIDNIHFTPSGFEKLYRLIDQKITEKLHNEKKT